MQFDYVVKNMRIMLCHLFYILLLAFCGSSFSAWDDECNCIHGDAASIVDESCTCNMLKSIKKSFFYTVISEISELPESQQKTSGIVGSAGLNIYNKDLIIENLDNIELLFKDDQEAMAFLYSINNRIQKNTYTIWPNNDISVDLNLTKKDSNKVKQISTVGEVTIYHRFQPLVSLEISVMPACVDSESINFNQCIFNFPKGVLFLEKSAVEIPILTKKSYVLLDQITIRMEIDKYTTQNCSENLLTHALYSCKMLHKINKNKLFYHDYKINDEAFSNSIEDLFCLFTTLHRTLKENNHIMEMVYGSAFNFRYQLNNNCVKNTNMSSACEYTTAKERYSLNSFEHLKILLFKDLKLTHIEPDENCFYQAVANIYNANEVAKNKFLSMFITLVSNNELSITNHHISPEQVRIFIHNWIAKAGFLVKDHDYKEIESLISTPTTEVTLWDLLTKDHIKKMDTDRYDKKHYGWSNLLFPVSIATGISIVVLAPQNEEKKVLSRLFCTKTAKDICPNLIEAIQHNLELVAVEEFVIKNTLFMVDSGYKNYYSCIPTPTLLKRLHPFIIAEEIILSTSLLDCGSSTCKPIKRDSTLSQYEVNNINRVLSLEKTPIPSVMVSGVIDCPILTMDSISDTIINIEKDDKLLSDELSNDGNFVSNINDLQHEESGVKEEDYSLSNVNLAFKNLNIKLKDIKSQLRETIRKNSSETEKAKEGDLTANTEDTEDNIVKLQQKIEEEILELVNEEISDISKCSDSLESEGRKVAATNMIRLALSTIAVFDKVTTSGCRYIVIDLDKIDDIAMSSLESADCCGDILAPLILAMAQMVKLDYDKVTTDKLYEIIKLLKKTAHRNNIQGSIFLYWLAAATGSPEAFSASLTSVQHVQFPPPKDTPILKFIVDKKSFLYQNIDDIVMPVRIKRMVEVYNQDSYTPIKDVMAFNLKHPVDMVIKLRLTPDLLFSNNCLEDEDMDKVNSTLTNLGASGYYYLHTGQNENSLGCFLQSAIAYLSLTSDCNNIQRLTKSAGLSSVYKSMCMLTNYNKQTSILALPSALQQWNDRQYLDIIIQGLKYKSNDTYVYAVLANNRDDLKKPVKYFKKTIDYIIATQNNRESECPCLENIEKEMELRQECFTYSPGKINKEIVYCLNIESGIKKEISSSHEETKTDTHKKTRCKSNKHPQKEQKKVNKTVKILLGDLGEKVKNLNKEIENIIAKKNIHSTNSMLDIDMRRMYVKLAISYFDCILELESNERAGIIAMSDEKNKCDILDGYLCTFVSMGIHLICFLSSLTTDTTFDAEVAKRICLFNKNILTKCSLDEAYTKVNNHSLLYRASCNLSFISLLDPDTYELIDKELLISLLNIFSFNHNTFLYPEVGKHSKINIVNLLSMALEHIHDHHNIIIIMDILYKLGDGCQMLLSKCLLKYFLSVSTTVELDNRKKMFDQVYKYISKLKLSDFKDRDLFLKTWQDAVSIHDMDMNNILQEKEIKANHFWNEIWLEEDKKIAKEEKQRSKAQLMLVQKYNQKSSQNDKNDESDETINNEESQDITIEEDGQNIEVDENNIDNNIAKFYKNKDFDNLLSYLDDCTSQENSDSLLMAKLNILKAECRIESFKNKNPIFACLRIKEKIAEKYLLQYGKAKDTLTFPKVTKNQLLSLCEQIKQMTKGIGKKNHCLNLAINEQNIAIDILGLFLDNDEDYTSNTYKLKTEFDLLCTQHKSLHTALNQIINICECLKGALIDRKYMLENIAKRRESSISYKSSTSAGVCDIKTKKTYLFNQGLYDQQKQQELLPYEIYKDLSKVQLSIKKIMATLSNSQYVNK